MKPIASFLSALTASLLLSCASQTSQQNIASGSENNADAFLVVDCLLPGQVRKLGQMATYITSRQPIKTTASDCEIRGGEYVAYDRANYGTALKIWLPRAQAGDAEAQAYVGEIYEKGLGLTPDYNLAAQWYQKAADQGNSRAQLNLGFLYEKGLGVVKDKMKAMEWYRKSSGLAKTDIPYAATLKVGEEKVTNNEISFLKSELKNSRNESRNLQERLQKIQQRLQESKNASQPVIAELKEQYQQQIQQLENRLEETKKRAQQLAEQMNMNASSSTDAERKLLENEAKLAEMEQRLLQFQKNTEFAETQTAGQQQKISQLEKEKQQLETKIQNLQQQTQLQTASGKPSIEIIDPPFVQVRGTPTVTLRSVVQQRDIVGKVIANAGLLSLLVNDKKSMVDEQGLFQTSVAIRSGETPVNVVAVDKKGGRASLDFIFAMASSSQGTSEVTSISSTPTPDRSWQSFDFGNYYALIIGNNKYEKVPSLDTPINDAKAIESVLKRKYGFQTQLLLNANRYQILSALNKLRSELTEKDNLLVYYAGHGELDKVNMRGHWLPVDAEGDNTANWISTVAITDILNTMSVQHIMVVADSCYSGAMTRSSIARLDAGISDEKKSEWLKAMIKSKSRTVLTSGGLKPVMDGGGGEHSVFASAFINALNDNNNLLEGQTLYRKVSAGIVAIAAGYGIEQVPIYAPIQHAGHESGEFFFIPKM